MRTASLVSVSFLVALATTPAAAQISATIHIGPIRIGHSPVYRDAYGPAVVVVPYSARNYGQWKKSARYWRPVTLYLSRGRYYQQPYRNARPVVVYRYRDAYFTAPHDRDWDRYRSRYERDYWRNDRRDDRYDRRDDRRGSVVVPQGRGSRRGGVVRPGAGAQRGTVVRPNADARRGTVVVPGRGVNRGAAKAAPSRARRRNG